MNTCLLVLGVLLGCAGEPVSPAGAVAAPAVAEGPVAATSAVAMAAVAPAVDVPTQVDSRVDPWLAEDKLQHFAMSFAATAMLYGGSRFVLDPDPAVGAAAAGAVALGVGKEVVDARSGRWFSWKDLVWDAAGVALGAVLATEIR